MIVFPQNLPPINRRIVEVTQSQFPILENPLGSNRSPEIDAMCKRWGVPLGSAWCALWKASVWFDAGADVPPARPGKRTKFGRERHPAVADWWREWAIENGLFRRTPQVGYGIVYGAGDGPAVHVDVCVSVVTPLLMSFGGNEAQMGFTREGTLTSHSPVPVDRVIGYIEPRLRA